VTRLVVLAAGATLALAACASSPTTVVSVTSAPSTATTPAAAVTVSTTQACQDLHKALNARINSDINNADNDWTGLASDVKGIAGRVEPADQALFQELKTATAQEAASSNPLANDGLWLDVMKRITARCKQAGYQWS
jgi:hypothetical protein